MKTKGALLLSTMLVASCMAAPTYAADQAEQKDTAKAESQLSTTAKEPTMDKDAVKDAGKKDRGIFINSIRPGNSSPKATTADNKNDRPAVTKPVTFSSLAGEQKVPKSLSNRTSIPAMLPKHNTSAKNVPVKSKNMPKVMTATKTIKGGHEQIVATKNSPIITAATTSDGEQVVTAWLNKRGDKPHYKDGERLQVNVAANKDCNVMIFNYDGQQLTQLYPNEFQGNPFVKAGQTIEVGGDGFKFNFTAANDAPKPSYEKIFVYAYPVETDSSPISVAMNKVEDSPFRAAEMTPEQYRDMVNQSKVFFGRKVKVSAKPQMQLASYEQGSEPTAAGPANKIELTLVITNK